MLWLQGTWRVSRENTEEAQGNKGQGGGYMTLPRQAGQGKGRRTEKKHQTHSCLSPALTSLLTLYLLAICYWHPFPSHSLEDCVTSSVPLGSLGFTLLLAPQSLASGRQEQEHWEEMRVVMESAGPLSTSMPLGEHVSNGNHSPKDQLCPGSSNCPCFCPIRTGEQLGTVPLLDGLLGCCCW